MFVIGGGVFLFTLWIQSSYTCTVSIKTEEKKQKKTKYGGYAVNAEASI